jgi:hypothetical protein
MESSTGTGHMNNWRANILIFFHTYSSSQESWIRICIFTAAGFVNQLTQTHMVAQVFMVSPTHK